MNIKATIGVLLIVAFAVGFVMAPGLLCHWFPNLQGTQFIDGFRETMPGGLAAAIIAIVHIIMSVVKGEPKDK
jgi:hypothetical protein